MRSCSLIPLCLALALPVSTSAAPVPASKPSDPDLKLDGTCRGGPSAKALRAAVPTRIPELVVLWPRVGATADKPCRPVGRVTIVDHQGLIMTVSFVLHGDAQPSETGFRSWFPDDGDAKPEPGRRGPPRNELVWVPDDRPGLHIVLAGSPSMSHDTLEGASGFLAEDGVLDALAALAE